MELITPASPEWSTRVMVRYGLFTTTELRAKAPSLRNAANQEWLMKLADRIDSMGLRRLAEVPTSQLALITAD